MKKKVVNVNGRIDTNNEKFNLPTKMFYMGIWSFGE